MDYRERLYDHEETHRVTLDGRMRRVWTALPGIITKVNFAHQTVEVQPAIQAQVSAPDGTSKNVNLPIIPDVPIMFPSGGGYTLTFPIGVGDHCLLHFASRCIDGWWDTGQVLPAMDKRMHDLSDAFATIGPRHRGGVPAGISDKTTTLRTDDGKLVIEMDGANGAINITTPTTVNITSPTVTVTATDHVNMQTPQLHVSGDIYADGEIHTNKTSVALGTHRHGGVQGGTGNTAPPIAGSIV